MSANIALIGAGLIGTSWAIAFARGGHCVRLHDAAPESIDVALAEIDRQLEQLAALDLLAGQSSGTIRRRIHSAPELAAALEGAEHVQENTPERLEVKVPLFARLDALTPATATIASSSSALLPSSFTRELSGAARCLVAHPLNPPHLIPAVELVPSPATDADAVRRLVSLLEGIGQRAIVLNGEVEGFVMNRLQGALLDEAFRLVDAGLVDAEGIDIAMRDGLGLRWSFMGPFETIDLNAPGGVIDYIARYGEAYRNIAKSAGPRADWQGDVAGRLHTMRRAVLPEQALAERRAWRDRCLMQLAAHKRQIATTLEED